MTDLVVIPDDLLAEATHEELSRYAAYLELEQRSWRFTARSEQLPPDGDWLIWYVRGGRGGGKTRTGAETLADWAFTLPGEWAVVAPTYGDARDVCVEGPSGLIAAIGRRWIRTWNRSLGELRLNNGSVIWADGADDGALRIQGRNLRGGWADEIGLWKRWRVAWDESLNFAVRLAPSRLVATGTPKRHMPARALIRRLLDDAATGDGRVVTTALRTRDNIANLAPERVRELEARYAGTQLGRQELEGELIDDVEGALWTNDMIDKARGAIPTERRLNADRSAWEEVPVDMARVVVAVDPATTSGEDSDETGIVVVGVGVDGRAYVLADRSCKLSPDGWGRRAVKAFEDFKADVIVAESNQGGQMVEHVLRTVAPRVPVKLIHASRGKVPRAEPVAALYEQKRVTHVDVFGDLEAQLTGWTPDSGTSPDRLDALVHGLTELMLEQHRRKLRFIA